MCHTSNATTGALRIFLSSTKVTDLNTSLDAEDYADSVQYDGKEPPKHMMCICIERMDCA